MQLRDGRVGVFSRPRSRRIAHQYGSEAVVGFAVIDSIDELDVRRYGVIVSSGARRGLLLPDLDGVDTPEQQVSIAMRKGGIDEDEPVVLERFEVIRHH